jgi:Sec-independent protein translocase protein TatA
MDERRKPMELLLIIVILLILFGGFGFSRRR